MERDIAYIQRQLILARWHLDAAIGASDSAGDHIKRARLAYGSVLEAVAQVDLTPGQREQLEAELVSVRTRLDMTRDGYS